MCAGSVAQGQVSPPPLFLALLKRVELARSELTGSSCSSRVLPSSRPEPDHPLFHPCKCSGSIRYVHQDCLIAWLQTSRKRYCETCSANYEFTKGSFSPYASSGSGACSPPQCSALADGHFLLYGGDSVRPVDAGKAARPPARAEVCPVGPPGRPARPAGRARRSRLARDRPLDVHLDAQVRFLIKLRSFVWRVL